jgi:chemotaxis methyl-accepting protein methylase
MRARGVHTYADYARLLDADAAEYEKLLDALTINVTKLFRNWDTYQALSTSAIPELWSRDTPTLRVWSAGCSSGQEAYSLAVLFHRHAATRGMLPQIGRVDILGTDIDRASLAAAERGQFAAPDFADTPDDLRRRYFTRSEPSTISPAVRAMVRFERRDLLSDPPPPGQHDLIACRNVLIYFDRDTQARLFDVFFDALAPGGYLLLGKVETLLGPARSRFMSVDSRERIFRRPA